MQVSTMQSQNYAVTTTRIDDENGHIYQHQNRNCTLTKRCICLLIPIIVVVLVMICAIVIPLVLTSSRNKNTSNLTTMSITESATSLEAMNITPATAAERNGTTSSSTLSNDTASITINETMTSAVSSTYDTATTASTKSKSTTPSPSPPIATTTTTTTPTTTPRPMIALNQANDNIIGLYNTTAGGSTGGFDGKYSILNETPDKAMDGNLATKYLNFGHKGGSDMVVEEPGIGTGFLVIPSVSNSTTACALHFATANDNPQRDPITVTLEGSNASTIVALHIGSSWELIYNGSTGIDDTSSLYRSAYGTLQNFSNKKPFASYRLLITSQRGDGDAVQYSEARIMGYV